MKKAKHAQKRINFDAKAVAINEHVYQNTRKLQTKSQKKLMYVVLNKYFDSTAKYKTFCLILG